MPSDFAALIHRANHSLTMQSFQGGDLAVSQAGPAPVNAIRAFPLRSPGGAHEAPT